MLKYLVLENLDLQNRELDGYIGPRITSQARWEMLVERYQPRSYLDNRLRSKNIAKDENAKMTWKSMRSGVCKYTKNMLKWIDKHNKHEYDHGGVTFVLPAGHAPVAHGQAPPIFWKDRREDRRRSANAPRQPRQPRAPRAPRVPAQRRARNNAGLAAGAGMAAQVPLPLFPGLPSSQVSIHHTYTINHTNKVRLLRKRTRKR